METKKEAAREILKYHPRLITSDVGQETWKLAKSSAALRGIRIGQWLSEAIREKYQRESAK